MALLDEVKTRVSDTLLKQLTNQDKTGPALTIDDVVLGAAADDAEAEFLTETGLAFDVTNKQHVYAGVQGTIYYLHAFTAKHGENTEALRARWDRAIQRLATGIGNERRVQPQTSSTLEPSTQVSGQRPDADRTRWDDFVLDPPGGDREEDFRFG